jgi:hypothetical protein
VWWTGIKSERLRSPEAASAIRLRLLAGSASEKVLCFWWCEKLLNLVVKKW